MNAGHVAGVARRSSSVPPFIATPGPRRAVAAHDDRAAADRRRRAVAGVAVDDDRPGEHALGQAPAGAAVDLDGRAIVHPAAVVADAAVERGRCPGSSSATPRLWRAPGFADRRPRDPSASAARIARLRSRIDRPPPSIRTAAGACPACGCPGRHQAAAGDGGRRSAARRRKTWPDGSCATPADPRASRMAISSLAIAT